MISDWITEIVTTILFHIIPSIASLILTSISMMSAGFFITTSRLLQTMGGENYILRGSEGFISFQNGSIYLTPEAFATLALLSLMITYVVSSPPPNIKSFVALIIANAVAPVVVIVGYDLFIAAANSFGALEVQQLDRLNEAYQTMGAILLGGPMIPIISQSIQGTANLFPFIISISIMSVSMLMAAFNAFVILSTRILFTFILLGMALYVAVDMGRNLHIHRPKTSLKGQRLLVLGLLLYAISYASMTATVDAADKSIGITQTIVEQYNTQDILAQIGIESAGVNIVDSGCQNGCDEMLDSLAHQSATLAVILIVYVVFLFVIPYFVIFK